MRVGPPRDALGHAGRLGLGPGHGRAAGGRTEVTVGSRKCRIPGSERPPDPRARPSSTVSAWSSSVWPRSTSAGPKCSAIWARAAYLASRAPASMPRTAGVDGHRDRRGLVDAERPPSAPTTARRVLGRALLQTVVDGHADDRERLPCAPRRRVAASSASESAPPEQATSSRFTGRGDRSRGAAYGEPHRGHRGIERHASSQRLSRGRARSTAPGRGSPSWSAGWPARPTRR